MAINDRGRNGSALSEGVSERLDPTLLSPEVPLTKEGAWPAIENSE